MARCLVRSCAGTLPVFLGITSAVAGTWEITPFVRAEALYTDNALLEETAAQSDVITTVAPGVRVEQQSRHFSGSFNGYVNQVMYRNNSAYDDRSSYMNVRGNAQAAENLVGLDGNVVFEERRTGQGAVYATRVVKGDREQVKDYLASPYLNLRLGPDTRFSARHTLFYQRHETRLDLNKNQSALAFRFESDRQGRVDWWAEHTTRETEYVFSGGQLTATTFNAGVGYLHSESWWLVGAVGRERYELSHQPERDFEATTWRAQAQWAMTPRTMLALGYGRRFYGDEYTIDFLTRGQSSTVTFGYREETIDQQYSRVSSDVLPDSLLTDLSRFIVSRRARGTADVALGKDLRLTIDGTALEREDVEADQKEWEAQAKAALSYELGPRTKAVLAHGAGRAWKRLSGYRNDRYGVSEFSVSRTVSKSATLEAGISAARVESTDRTREYEELAARLGIRAEF
ncbi:MAG: TIGR03016 family PEP-CTERM system-associated outer membrane protein [Pseudomonadota bacterium]